MDTLGADALRWYLVSSPVLRGLDLQLDEKAIADVVRNVVLPFWNAYSFFTLYANTDGYEATLRSDATGLLDRYMLAKTHELVASVDRAPRRLRPRRRLRRRSSASSTRSPTGTSAAAASASGAAAWTTTSATPTTRSTRRS